jgi:membrane-bound metal-dependent hydrolase YbcI (DUF457 family)
MFIGHYGLALASKKTNATIRLGTAVLAAQFLDLLWPIFTILGWEKFSIEPGNTKMTPLNFEYYPYSHSLLGSIVLALSFAFVYFIIKKDFKTSAIYAFLVFSHWVLDFITHRPDLPLTYTSSEKVGLGLWNFPAAAIFLECLIYAAGIYLYLKSTRAINKKGTILIWIFISVFAIFYIMNLAGPPPPSAEMVSWSSLILWLFVFLGYWIDKNRSALK